jgi:hypothetical protein
MASTTGDADVMIEQTTSKDENNNRTDNPLQIESLTLSPPPSKSSNNNGQAEQALGAHKDPSPERLKLQKNLPRNLRTPGGRQPSRSLDH